MIQVMKGNAPVALAGGCAHIDQCCAMIEAEPVWAGSIDQPFKFLSKVYGHANVKAALQAAQHDKCCYCEGIFSAHSPGDVEHYRPKTFSQQAVGAPKIYPGYYWLAYDWQNLFYSCDRCNRSAKRNLFPLANPASRACNPSTAIDLEDPLILDPGGADDPRSHIKFRGAAPYGVTTKGRETIIVLKLDRPALTTARLKRLKHLKALLALAAVEPSLVTPEIALDIEAAKQELCQVSGQTAEFSAMAQDLLISCGYELE